MLTVHLGIMLFYWPPYTGIIFYHIHRTMYRLCTSGFVVSMSSRWGFLQAFQLIPSSDSHNQSILFSTFISRVFFQLNSCHFWASPTLLFEWVSLDSLMLLLPIITIELILVILQSLKQRQGSHGWPMYCNLIVKRGYQMMYFILRSPQSYLDLCYKRRSVLSYRLLLE